MANLTERGAIDPVIKLTVALSESGFVSAKEAVAYGEVKDESLTGVYTISCSSFDYRAGAGMLKGLFGGGPGEQEVLKEQGAEGTAQEGEAQQVTPPSKEKKTNGEKKKDMSTIPLDVDVVFSSLPPMTVAEKRASRDRFVRSFSESFLYHSRFTWDRLRAIDSKETSKLLREEAHNTLEAYLYRLRDLLEDGPDSPFMKCSKATERQAISSKLADTIAWLHEEGETADTMELRQKRGALECVISWILCFDL